VSPSLRGDSVLKITRPPLPFFFLSYCRRDAPFFLESLPLELYFLPRDFFDRLEVAMRISDPSPSARIPRGSALLDDPPLFSEESVVSSLLYRPLFPA